MRNKGFVHILVLIFVILGIGVLGYFLWQKGVIKKISSPEVTPTPFQIANPKYINTKYGFSVELPNNFDLPDESAEYGFLGDKIYFSVSEINPLDCRGDCPVISKTSSVPIANTDATKIEGYFGEIGGNIAQHYVKYVFQNNNLYYSFNLQALSKDTDPKKYYENLKTEDAIPEVKAEDFDIFNQILSTFKFIDNSNEQKNFGRIINLYQKRGEFYLDFDKEEIYFDQIAGGVTNEATQECIKDGECVENCPNLNSCSGVMDGYYRKDNDGDIFLNYKINQSTVFQTALYKSIFNSRTYTPGEVVNLEKVANEFSKNPNNDFKQAVWWITINNGEVVSINEQYVP